MNISVLGIASFTIIICQRKWNEVKDGEEQFSILNEQSDAKPVNQIPNKIRAIRSFFFSFNMKTKKMNIFKFYE